MNGVWTFTAWTCMGLVSLPMSLCALIPGMCHLAQAPAAVVADAAKQPPTATQSRSCCHDSTDAGNQTSHEKPAAPCPRGCCRLIPIAPTLEKIVPPASPWCAVVPPAAIVDAQQNDSVPVAEPLLPARTLQSLSCLWRC